MLAPVAESDFGEGALTRARHPRGRGLRGVLRRAGRAPGRGPGLPRDRHADRRPRPRRRGGARARCSRSAAAGLPVERLRPSQARRAEPALAPTVRLALDVPGDHSADPRKLVAALSTAVQRAGGEVRHGARVVEVLTRRARHGVRLADGGVVRAGRCPRGRARGVGRWTSPDPVPVRPVKGQIMRLHDPRGPGLVERTIRTPQGGYLVARGDGRYVLGATVEERGFDTAPTAGGVFELVRDLSEVMPGVLELELDEVAAGLRPARPTTCRRSARARSRASCGRPATTETGSCSPRSRAVAACCRPRCRVGRCRGLRHASPSDPARLAVGLARP